MSPSSMEGKIVLPFVWLALVVIQLGFGAYGVIIIKFAKNSKADPLMFCVVRDGGCFPVLFVAALVAEKKFVVPKRRDLPILISLGVTGMFGNQLLYLLGVYYTTADIASMFQPLIPVWTTIIAIVTRTEKFPHLRKPKGWAKIMGIILASAGAMTMIMVKHKVDTGSNSKESGELFLGYIFLLGNTICMGVYIVIQKKYIFNKPDSVWRTLPVSVTAWAYFFGFIAMALASLYYVKTPERYTQIPARAIYSIIYAIFITSALCYLLITWCNMQISSTVVTATWPLQVFFTIILSYIFLGEVMSPVQYIGGIMILIGLAFVLWSNFQDEKEFKSLDSENKPLICTTNDVDNNKKA